MTIRRKNTDGTYDVIAGKTIIVDNLNSDSGDKALSAKQGHVLEEKIDALAQTFYDMIYPKGHVYIGFVAPNVPAGITATWELDTTYNGKLLKVDTTKVPGTSGGNASHAHTLSKKGGACIGWTWTISESNMLLGITGDAMDCDATFYSSSRMPANGYTSDYRNLKCVPLRGSSDNATIDPPYITIKVWKRTA